MFNVNSLNIFYCLKLGLELVLGNTGTHGSSGSNTSSDHSQNTVNVLGSGPLLVLDNLTTLVNLGLLDLATVSLHTLLRVGLGELVGDESVGVQTGKGDELPHVAELGQSADVGLLVLGGHGGGPVERGRQVVSQPLVGDGSLDTIGELLGLSVVGQLGLHPDEISVGSVSNTSVDGTLGSSLVSVVALSDSGSLPVEVEVLSEESRSKGSGLKGGGVGKRGHLLVELGEELGLVGVRAGVDGIGKSLVEELDTGLSVPVVLNGLQSGALLALELGGNHDVDQVAGLLVGGAGNEVMVSVIDGGGDEGGGLGIGSGNGQQVRAEDIGGGSDGNQSVDVLLDGDQHLSGHVATLLGTRGLVLNVDTGGTSLDEHLGELDDGSQTSVTSVGIGNDGSQVVDGGRELGSLGLGDGKSLLVLLSVVEQLGKPQVLDLVGNGVHGVVSEIGRGLVGGGGGRRRLPSGNVDGVEVLGHLGHLDGVKGTVGERGSVLLLVLLEQLVQLVGLLGRSLGDLDGSSSRGNVLGGVDTLGVLPSGGGPPLLDLLDFVVESLLFGHWVSTR